LIPPDQLPGAANSFFTSLLPVLLLGLTTLVGQVYALEGFAADLNSFLGEASIVMLISVLVATFTLGTGTGKSMKEVMTIYGDAMKDIALILLIVAGAGVLKQVFVDSGVSDEIAKSLQGVSIPPWYLAG
jgi:H+/gluconate symporter and related permeases